MLNDVGNGKGPQNCAPLHFIRAPLLLLLVLGDDKAMTRAHLTF